MKRLELFEFEDFNWVPSAIRTGGTNLIIVFHKLVGTADVLADLILDMKNKVDFDQVVDLGSGSGGPMLECFRLVNEKNKGNPINLILTDLYPNSKLVAEINGRKLPNIHYSTTPTNATEIDQVSSGLKTMIASFHHMKPEIARQILKSSEESQEPILIYELAKNNVPTLIWWLFLPISLIILFLMSLFMTPFVRPLSMKQLLFTYVIPLIPILYAWDGQASLMRTYTFDDIKKLIGNSQNPNYKWEMGDAKKPNGKNAGYYVKGYPIA